MSDRELLRWLELVKRQLHAHDARVEIGGEPPTADDTVWAELPGGRRRVVVVFAERPADVPSSRRRLEGLVASFAGMAQSGEPRPSAGASGVGAAAELNATLARLAARADALQAIVIDATSPVLWGTSHERPPIAVDAVTVQRRAERLRRAQQAGLDPAQWLAARAAGARPSELGPALAGAARELAEEFSVLIQHQGATAEADWIRLQRVTLAVAACRQRFAALDGTSGALRDTAPGDHVAWLARTFASIYVLLLVFDGPVSELRAEGAMIQSVGAIERLVLSLPPVDPPRPGGRVIRLKR